ncbi:hypothetical protein, partial [Enterococcus faecalis]|uniref:hypothetical protein n=1 Tax=Enterococcus faecalis TaxID=1351 RepID=UPI003D131189
DRNTHTFTYPHNTNAYSSLLISGGGGWKDPYRATLSLSELLTIINNVKALFSDNDPTGKIVDNLNQ